MSLELFKKRREMLKLNSLGFTRTEMMKALEQKYNALRRALYYDWRNRSK